MSTSETALNELPDWLSPGRVLHVGVSETAPLFRVLHTDPPELAPEDAWHLGIPNVVLIEILGEASWPIIFSLADAFASLRTQRWRAYEGLDPFPYVFRHQSEIPAGKLAGYIQKRDALAAALEPITSRRPYCYLPLERGRLIPVASRASGYYQNGLRIGLRRYWQAGEDMNALWPRFSQRGARTISEALEDRDSLPRRRGRPKAGNTAPQLGEIDFSIQSRKLRADILKEFAKYVRDARTKGALSRGNGFPWEDAMDQIANKLFIQATETRRDERGNVVSQPVVARSELGFSPAQLKRLVLATESMADTVRQIEGEKNFNRLCRIRTGDPRQLATAPGSIYQFDWMLADVFLVSRLTRMPCGRPYVFFVVDQFSRMIVGVYVTYEAPNYRTAARALAVAFGDKVEFAAQHGLHINRADWPSRHVCWRLLADNGELASYASDTIVKAELCDIANTPPFRADLKGLIESTFRCSNIGTIKWLRGYTRGPRERCAPDPRLASQLDIDQFTQLLINWVVKVYNNRSMLGNYEPTPLMLRCPVALTPLEIWNWGLQRLGRPRIFSPQELRQRLFPREDATIRSDGLWFDSIRYLSDNDEFKELMFRAGDYGTPARVSFDIDFARSVTLHRPGLAPLELGIAESSSQYQNASFAEATMAMEDQGALQITPKRRSVDLRRSNKLFSQRVEMEAAAAISVVHRSTKERNSAVKYSDPKEQRGLEKRRIAEEERTAALIAPKPASPEPTPIPLGPTLPTLNTIPTSNPEDHKAAAPKPKKRSLADRFTSPKPDNQ